MGRGKSSTILPLILLNNLYFNDSVKNIFITLPETLIEQTYKMLKQNIRLLDNNMCKKLDFDVFATPPPTGANCRFSHSRFWESHHHDGALK